MPENPPSRTTSGTRSGDAFNRTVENARSHQPVSSPAVRSGHTVHGTFFESDESGYSYSSESGEFRWSNPIAYNKDSSYKKGEVTIILPSASIVTAGAASADDSGSTITAQAGIWVAMQAVSPEDQGGGTFWYHIPHLPLPNESDIDSEQNFWMQITSFCDS